MTIIGKTINSINKLRAAKNIEILEMQLSIKANNIFINNSMSGFINRRSKKYVELFYQIPVKINIQKKGIWVQIIYKTPVSNANSITLRGENDEQEN